MNIFLIISVIILILAIILIFYFYGYNKLKNYHEKMVKAENIIDDCLNKKLDLIIAINSDVKKVTGQKDYLKDYVSINGFIMTNIEKDLKLTEAVKLIRDLVNDFDSLNKDEEFNKLIYSLNEIEEKLISAKNIYNQNALLSNQLIKTFPNNLIAKIGKFKLTSIYANNNDNQEN